MSKIQIYRSLLFCLLIPFNSALANDELTILPAPPWIKSFSVNYNKPYAEELSAEGVQYLLVDYQTRLAENSLTSYYHTERKATDLNGVESIATISIDFNPSYEKLQLHEIKIIRQGMEINQLNSDKIKLLQRESELEFRIYNGGKTATLILDDVRIDDVVAVSYSISGSNPVFNNKLYANQIVQWSVPVHQFRYRMMWPEKRLITITRHKTAIEPQVSRNNGYIEYFWSLHDVPPILSDGQLPSDYTLYPWLQLSEMQNWNEVVQWALPLYQQSNAIESSELTELIQRFAKRYTTPEQRVRAVMQFMQEQIRYMGIEIGTDSYAPTPPSLVLQRRFGDCKDKTVLMITLLKALGIEAVPALVNTKKPYALARLQPTPAAFNHVLVKVTVNEQDYWLDPTLPPQQGTLDKLYQPDYGQTLLVKQGVKALKAMPPASLSKKLIIDEWRLKPGDNIVEYTIATHYEGGQADKMRQSLALYSLAELEKKYLNYFARIYPSIKIRAPLSVKDDKENNKLTISEYYAVSNFWVASKDAPDELEAEFYPVDFFDYSGKPNTIHRTMPLAIDYPVQLEQHTTVHLNEDWPITPYEVNLDNPGFQFHKTVGYKQEVLYLDYRYQSKTNSIAAQYMSRYLEDLEQMDDEMGYALWQNTAIASQSTATAINWTLLILLTLASVIFIALAIWVYRYQPNKILSVSPNSDAELSGIKGWLLLPAIGILFTPLKLLITSYQDLYPVLQLSAWNSLTQIGSEVYHPSWAPILIFETLTILGLFIFSLILIPLFFQKRRTLPRFYILFMSLSIIIYLVDIALFSYFEPTAENTSSAETKRELIQAFSPLIWIAYFRVSERVKATFINDYNKSMNTNSELYTQEST